MLIEQQMLDINCENIGNNDILNQFGLKSLCIHTISNWMERLGLECSVMKNSYHVGGHVNPDTIKD